MYLTKENYNQIAEWIKSLGRKDTDYPLVEALNDTDTVVVVKDGYNKRMYAKAFAEWLDYTNYTDLSEQVSKLKSYCNTTFFAQGYVTDTLSVIIDSTEYTLEKTITFENYENANLYDIRLDDICKAIKALNTSNSSLQENIDNVISNFTKALVKNNWVLYESDSDDESTVIISREYVQLNCVTITDIEGNAIELEEDSDGDYCYNFKEAGYHVLIFEFSSEVTSLENFFENSAVVTVGNGLFNFEGSENITSICCMFNNCKKLTAVPYGIFSCLQNVIKVSTLFTNCTALKSIPEGLFSAFSYLEQCSEIFSGCESLTTVPSSLFSTSYSALYFDYLFANCTSLVTVPKGLFDNCVSMKDIKGMFKGCESLTYLPSSLFRQNKSLSNINELLYGCTAFTGNLIFTAKNISSCSNWLGDDDGSNGVSGISVYVIDGTTTQETIGSEASTTALADLYTFEPALEDTLN